MCTGRVDLSFVLKSFQKGADAVCIIGCHPGECNYATNGNFHAFNMVQLCKKILKHIGINPERLMIEWCSSGEGIRFARIITDFSEKIRSLGPLGKGEGEDENKIESELERVIKLVPYIKVAKRDKLNKVFDNIEEYTKLYSDQEVEDLLTNVPSYYINPEKCQACGTCRRNCPADAIVGDKNKIHVIDQEKCIKCGTCYEVCPPKFKAVEKIVGKPVPPPIPEEKRIILRKGKEAS